MSSSDNSDLEEKMDDLKIEDDKYINILLLGETGVGKSTFVNAMANYLSYKYIDRVEKQNLHILIPSSYKIKDKNNQWHNIQIGPVGNKNEFLETGISATQRVKTYVFPIRNGIKIRFIDTPGMGDTRGLDQDEINCDNILCYLTTLQKLHGICFLFKPTNARKTVYFNYCISQILSRFDKSACKNIIFVFTNTRGSDYGPGDTKLILEKVVGDIKDKSADVEIPLNKQNIFCFDNEAFRYLAAVKYNIQFSEAVIERNKKSWETSAKQCWNFIRYIQSGAKNRPPYTMGNLQSISTARNVIFQMSSVLADIMKLINDNDAILGRLRANRDLELEEVEELKRKQCNAVTDVIVTKTCQPIMVCTSITCCEVYKVGDQQKYHYKKVCHGPCFELNNVPHELIGCPELVNCAVINKLTRQCTQCGCDFSIHQHVDYITRTEQSSVLDPSMMSFIASKESVLRNFMVIINDISANNGLLRNEYTTIQEFCTKLAGFLQNNTISPFGECYKEYIEYLINQQQCLGNASDKTSVQNLKMQLEKFAETKLVFDRALELNITSEMDLQKIIKEGLQVLFSLKCNGKKIKDLHESQQQVSFGEPKVEEYVHTDCFEKDEDFKKKVFEKNKKHDKSDKPKGQTDDQRRDYKKSSGGNPENERKNRNANNRAVSRERNERRNRGRTPQRQRARTPPPPYTRPQPQYPEPPRSEYPPYSHLPYAGYNVARPNYDYSSNPRNEEPQNRDTYEVKVSIVKPGSSHLPRTNENPPTPNQNSYGASYGHPPTSGAYGPPPRDGSYGPPPHAGGYRPPPHGGAYGPPPYGGAHGPPPHGGAYGPPPYGGAYGPPPPHGGAYGPPPHGGAYGPPPHDGAYGPPPRGGAYGPPPSGGPYGPPPAHTPFQSRPHGPRSRPATDRNEKQRDQRGNDQNRGRGGNRGGKGNRGTNQQSKPRQRTKKREDTSGEGSDSSSWEMA